MNKLSLLLILPIMPILLIAGDTAATKQEHTVYVTGIERLQPMTAGSRYQIIKLDTQNPNSLLLLNRSTGQTWRLHPTTEPSAEYAWFPTPFVITPNAVTHPEEAYKLQTKAAPSSTPSKTSKP
jgi:hypothetical protein